MLLTRRALFLLLLTALLLALATLEPVFVYVAIAYLALVTAMIFADRALTPSPRAFQITRTNDSRLSLGADNRVVIRVENLRTRAVRAIARDEYPPEFRADRILLDDTARQFLSIPTVPPKPFSLKPRVPVELAYHVRPPHRG